MMRTINHRARPSNCSGHGSADEITPEMIEAGVLELVTFGDWDQAKDAVSRIYSAMRSVERREAGKARCVSGP